MFFDRKIKLALKELVDDAWELGLPEHDVLIVREYIDYNELELAFEHIVEQLYEFDVLITREFYGVAERCAMVLKMPIDSYVFIKKLIK